MADVEKACHTLLQQCHSNVLHRCMVMISAVDLLSQVPAVRMGTETTLQRQQELLKVCCACSIHCSVLPSVKYVVSPNVNTIHYYNGAYA